MRTEARVHTITAVFRSLATALHLVRRHRLDPRRGRRRTSARCIAGAGIVGVALGFGTQTMVRDFIAGFFLVVEDQYGVGDTVDLGGEAKGTVEAITLRSTRLRDVEGNVWWVPNGQLTRVANKSHEWARALIDVVVPYQADLDRVCDLMKAVADDLTADERWAREVLEAADVWGVQELGSRRRRGPHGHQDPARLAVRPAARAAQAPEGRLRPGRHRLRLRGRPHRGRAARRGPARLGPRSRPDDDAPPASARSDGGDPSD